MSEGLLVNSYEAAYLRRQGVFRKREEPVKPAPRPDAVEVAARKAVLQWKAGEELRKKLLEAGAPKEEIEKKAAELALLLRNR